MASLFLYILMKESFYAIGKLIISSTAEKVRDPRPTSKEQ